MWPQRVNTGEIPLRQTSPLPWLLLAITLLTGAGIFAMARTRLSDEKQRAANALKANDEVMQRLRAANAELEKVRADLASMETRRAEVEKHVVELEVQKQNLEAELEEAKQSGRKKR
jgi:septal ring factor EnvC (AmiA/AmiB activator)